MSRAGASSQAPDPPSQYHWHLREGVHSVLGSIETLRKAPPFLPLPNQAVLGRDRGPAQFWEDQLPWVGRGGERGWTAAADCKAQA